MIPRDSYETTSYSLKDLTAAELKALIDQFPGGQVCSMKVLLHPKGNFMCE